MSQGTNDENTTIILEEEIDEGYEPTQEEILEYAAFLGMDPVEDKDLMWIAKEGLKAPLPEPWKPCKTAKKELYYFNFQTGESTWDHPCDQHYKQVYLEEKTKKMRKGGKVPPPRAEEGKTGAVKKLLNLPTRQSEKLKAETDKLDAHYEGMLANFEDQKSDELDNFAQDIDSQLQKLEDEQKQLMMDSSDSDLHNNPQLKRKEEELRRNVKQEYDARLQKAKTDFDAKLEREKAHTKENFARMREVQENSLKKQNESDIAALKHSEGLRVDSEKSKADVGKSSSMQSAEKETDKLKRTLETKVEEMKSILDEQFEEELNNYRLELEQERKMVRERVEGKNEREIGSEMTKLKLRSNQKAIDAIEERNKRESQIREKYAKMRKALEDDNKKKADDLPGNNKSISADPGKYKDEISRLQREIHDNLSDVSRSIRLEELKEQARVAKEFEEAKSRYDAEAESKIRRLDSEHSNFKTSALGTKGIADEIAGIKKSAEFIEGLTDQKNAELKLVRNHTRALERDANELKNKVSDLQESALSACSRDAGRSADREVERLQEDSRERDREIRELERKIETAASKPVAAARSVTMIEPPEDLERLAQDVNEIKKIVIDDKRRTAALPKRSHTAGKYYRTVSRPEKEFTERRENEKRQHLLEAETESNIKRSEAKLKEIALFVGNEKAELVAFKKRSVTDYEVLTKLLGTLERNRREWRNELAQNRANPARKAVLESVKEKLDVQAQTLTKQVSEIKEQMMLNEKKLSMIRLLDKRLQLCPDRHSGDFLYLASNLQKEYELYLKKYKYGGGGGNSDEQLLYNAPSVPSLSGIIEPGGTDALDMFSPTQIPIPAFEEKYEQKAFIEGNRARRGKSLHNVYKNVANYQDALKKMCQRDIVKLAQNRHNVTDMFKDEANWLYQMKTEVARTTYGFAKGYQ